MVSYRLRKTIADLSSSRQMDLNFRDIRHVVDCHRNTLQLVHLIIMSGRYYMMVSKTITDAKDEKEIFICIFFLIGHLAFLYICCYSGQLIIDRSLNVFKDSYNSTWYYMPLEAQKLLLFIMLRSSTESVINIFGFFVASHAGYSKLLSTSFSYFTMIYSNQ
ncbi:odorant receptor 67c-like [Bombus impatiens]|uniref:Odorant receptor 67c-like n=1 Tax=Bombus impatiens TaxID=132113 RepID=A0A6P8LJE7_BOMIM|nr:odorant receptor 67c-like [Bombus impatiens]